MAINRGISEDLSVLCFVCVQLAARMLEKADYEYALELFVTAQTSISEQVDVFCEHNALEICFDHFRNKFLKKDFPGETNICIYM